MRGFAALLLLLGMLWLSVSAQAADIGYSGPIDSYSGAEFGTEDGGSDEMDISSGVVYVTSQRMYRYDTRQGSVYTSVVSGMVVQDTVSIQPDDSMAWTLFRNGVPVEEPNLTSIVTEGSYVFQITQADGTAIQLLTFTIVGDISCQLTGYEMPTGFLITDATLDGTAAPYERGYISMMEEGTYKVQYQCPAAGEVYTLSVQIDHTPPELTLVGVENGVAHGPVQLEGQQEGDTVAVYLDGSPEWYAVGDELTKSGSYTVQVTDEAGNRTTYAFDILLYFDFNSYVVFLIVFAVLASLVTYLVLARKRLRVR